MILTNAPLRTHAHGTLQPFDANLWILLIATVVTIALAFTLFDYIHLWARQKRLKRVQEAGGCSEDNEQALELEKDKFKSARLGHWGLCVCVCVCVCVRMPVHACMRVPVRVHAHSLFVCHP